MAYLSTFSERHMKAQDTERGHVFHRAILKYRCYLQNLITNLFLVVR